MSSSRWPGTLQAGGIFASAPGNPFAAANKVYVAYCSSDAWMGDASAFGYQFRGQAIVSAVLADLQTVRGLSVGDRMLFSGCSAGARGAMVHLDNVASALPGVTVRGLLDSGLWVDVQPYDPSQTASLLDETQTMASFLNAGAVIPDDCAAAYVEAAYKCLFGQYRMPFVATPYFASESQLDQFLITYDLSSPTNMQGLPDSPGEVTWADDLQVAVVVEVESLPSALTLLGAHCRCAQPLPAALSNPSPVRRCSLNYVPTPSSSRHPAQQRHLLVHLPRPLHKRRT